MTNGWQLARLNNRLEIYLSFSAEKSILLYFLATEEKGSYKIGNLQLIIVPIFFPCSYDMFEEKERESVLRTASLYIISLNEEFYLKIQYNFLKYLY